MTFKEQVQQVIDDLTPYIQSHGGAIVLLEVDEKQGHVHVQLQGACVSCPLSSVTLRHGLEDEMKKRIKEFVILTHE